MALNIENSFFSGNLARSVDINQLEEEGTDGNRINEILNDPASVSGSGGAISLSLDTSASARYKRFKLIFYKSLHRPLKSQIWPVFLMSSAGSERLTERSYCSSQTFNTFFSPSKSVIQKKMYQNHKYQDLIKKWGWVF